jgi:hypothetical protein
MADELKWHDDDQTRRGRAWASARQRVVVLTFDTIEEAEAWDRQQLADGDVLTGVAEPRPMGWPGYDERP